MTKIIKNQTSENYKQEKKKIERKNLIAKEYEKAIKEICKKLNY